MRLTDALKNLSYGKNRVLFVPTGDERWLVHWRNSSGMMETRLVHQDRLVRVGALRGPLTGLPVEDELSEDRFYELMRMLYRVANNLAEPPTPTSIYKTWEQVKAARFGDVGGDASRVMADAVAEALREKRKIDEEITVAVDEALRKRMSLAEDAALIDKSARRSREKRDRLAVDYGPVTDEATQKLLQKLHEHMKEKAPVNTDKAKTTYTYEVRERNSSATTPWRRTPIDHPEFTNIEDMKKYRTRWGQGYGSVSGLDYRPVRIQTREKALEREVDAAVVALSDALDVAEAAGLAPTFSSGVVQTRKGTIRRVKDANGKSHWKPSPPEPYPFTVWPSWLRDSLAF